jgi:hypothetical protein
VRRRAHRLAADLGDDDVGPDLVEDALEREEVADGAVDRARLGQALDGPVGPVDVAQREHVVGGLDAGGLGGDLPGGAAAGELVGERVRPEAAPGEGARGARRPRDVDGLVAEAGQLLRDPPVEVALVEPERQEQEAHGRLG